MPWGQKGQRMEIQHLRHLVAASESPSFAKAARKCFTSRQNVAHSVKAIENRLGVTLFERKGNEMVLTSEGIEAVRAAREIVSKKFVTISKIIKGIQYTFDGDKSFQA